MTEKLTYADVAEVKVEVKFKNGESMAHRIFKEEYFCNNGELAVIDALDRCFELANRGRE